MLVWWQLWVSLDLCISVHLVYNIWQLLNARSSPSLPIPPVPGGLNVKNSGIKHIPIPLGFLLLIVGSYIAAHIFSKPSGIIISGTSLACLSCFLYILSQVKPPSSKPLFRVWIDFIFSVPSNCSPCCSDVSFPSLCSCSCHFLGCFLCFSSCSDFNCRVGKVNIVKSLDSSDWHLKSFSNFCNIIEKSQRKFL